MCVNESNVSDLIPVAVTTSTSSPSSTSCWASSPTARASSCSAPSPGSWTPPGWRWRPLSPPWRRPHHHHHHHLHTLAMVTWPPRPRHRPTKVRKKSLNNQTAKINPLTVLKTSPVLVWWPVTCMQQPMAPVKGNLGIRGERGTTARAQAPAAAVS